MSRISSQARVLFFEEPIFHDGATPHLQRNETPEGVTVLTPVLPHGLPEHEVIAVQQGLVDGVVAEAGSAPIITWYYTPMSLRFSSHLEPAVTVYDCMDELSAFQGAPPELIEHERELFRRAHVVFAGGASLFESKRTQHHNVHLFPSSIDAPHFAQARSGAEEPEDQRHIPQPRIGFYGVLDERLDRDLIRDAAALRPDLQFVLIGPVVKIREDELPRAANIHYLGQKSYTELPRYLAHWAVAMLPFARNASTRFISPTKTPEYLAAGRPVVSTPIRDVVQPYGELGLVQIAETPEQFVAAIDRALHENDPSRQARVDAFLADMSWNKTFHGMWNQIQKSGPELERESVSTVSA